MGLWRPIPPPSPAVEHEDSESGRRASSPSAAEGGPEGAGAGAATTQLPLTAQGREDSEGLLRLEQILRQADLVLEPTVLDVVRSAGSPLPPELLESLPALRDEAILCPVARKQVRQYVSAGGKPQTVVELLSDNYIGYAQMASLGCYWLGIAARDPNFRPNTVRWGAVSAHSCARPLSAGRGMTSRKVSRVGLPKPPTHSRRAPMLPAASRRGRRASPGSFVTL